MCLECNNLFHILMLFCSTAFTDLIHIVRPTPGLPLESSADNRHATEKESAGAYLPKLLIQFTRLSILHSRTISRLWRCVQNIGFNCFNPLFYWIYTMWTISFYQHHIPPLTSSYLKVTIVHAHNTTIALQYIYIYIYIYGKAIHI